MAVFGVDRRMVAAFEELAKRASTGNHGWVDLLYPGQMAVEHKSLGEDLDGAMGQLLDYLPSLHKSEFPWLLVVCDFEHFQWKNLETGDSGTFTLAEFPHNVQIFWWMAGHGTPQWTFEDEETANLAATALLAKVHDGLRAARYDEHALRELLTRILFCLFADDTDVWDRGLFHTYLARYTREDGMDLGPTLNYIFQILDMAPKDRPVLDPDLAAFTYINGDLFEKTLPIPTCNEEIRTALLAACRFDWSIISPAIFGSMFQNVMTAAERRQLGAHYTSEPNILRTIGPLFLDDLWKELDAADTTPALNRFHDKLARLKFMDPACGCGNFLVIAYRELRKLEDETLRRLAKRGAGGNQPAIGLNLLCKVKVDQFFGIEIEEWPALIARTALYLIDHICNRDVSAEFGQHYVRFPIPASPSIVIGNALQMDWSTLVTPGDLFVFGNPPFVGKKARNADQQEDMRTIFDGATGTATLDYVAAWYQKAVEFSSTSHLKVAFVSTSSITQGEQVPILWQRLLDQGIDIGFAHRPFDWASEAKGPAHVQCVIIGFEDGGWSGKKRLFDYPDPQGEPVERAVKEINPYLVDAPVLLVEKRRSPLGGAPAASFGSMPNDGGFLLLSDEEAADLKKADPVAAAFLREMASTHQMLRSERRWCLWLADTTSAQRRSSPELRRRIESVRRYREKSTRAQTKQLAATPYLFGEIRQPTSNYLCAPRHVSENRTLLPMLFLPSTVIASDSTIAIPGADHYFFGVLQSAMFMAWLRAIGGKLDGRLRFSAEVVYNTFPFPSPSAKQKASIATAGKEVLAARASEPGSSLVDLYDPDAMPEDLVKAHRALDRAVDSAFSRKRMNTDADRLTLLFERYAEMVGIILPTSGSTTRAKKKSG